VATNKTRTIFAILAISTVAACSTNRGYLSGGDVDLSVATPATLDDGQLTVLRQMSDANILGHLMALDSLEVGISDTALRYVKGDEVAAYAKMMHLMHTDDWKTLRDIAGSTGLVPTIDVAKLRSSRIAAGMDSVRKTSDITRDQLYMRSQIELHQHALAEMEVLEGVARNSQIKSHISAMIPVVRDHLARAMAMAKPLGIK
jgi:predicted outer membrane protein